MTVCSGWYILQIGRTARLVNKVYIILLQMNAVYLLSAFVSACDTLPFRSAVGRYCARLLSVCLSHSLSVLSSVGCCLTSVY